MVLLFRHHRLLIFHKLVPLSCECWLAVKKHNVQEKNEARNMRETIKVIFDFQFGSMVILKTSNVEHINIKLLIRPMNNGK